MTARLAAQIVGVSKSYALGSSRRTVLRDVNLNIASGERLGILGRNGAGKSTLIRLISGQELPDIGQVVRYESISWPLAFSGGFQGSLTGEDNVRFIARIYGVDSRTVGEFVRDFSELGSYMRQPVKTYSTGMQARLAFALSLAIDFDCYLIDEVLAVGDSRFQSKCTSELFVKRAGRTFILVSHDANFLLAHCTRLAVLRAGTIIPFDSPQDALNAYENQFEGTMT